MDEGLINEQFGMEYFNGPAFGVWLFGGETADPKRVEAEICAEIARLQKDGVPRARFDALKKGIYGQIVSGLDDTMNCGELILSHLIDGIQPLAELDALAAMTADDIDRQLRERIPVDHHTLSVVKPDGSIA